MAHGDAWGLEPGKPPSLARFAVELDQRFLTELTHTTVLFNELFDQSGRRQLLKVDQISAPFSFSVIACIGQRCINRTVNGLWGMWSLRCDECI